MASILRDAYFKEGTHKVSMINNGIGVRPMANGARLTTSDVDNGVLVELDGYDTEGTAQCKPLTSGSVQAYIVQNPVAEGLFIDKGETDWKNFYNAKGEMVTLYPVVKFLRQETNNYVVDPSATLVYGAEVLWDTANNQFVVGGTASSTVISVAKVVDVETDLGYNTDAGNTIRIEYK